MIRRNRSKIGTLLINGDWSSDPDFLKSHVLNYFTNLFQGSSLPQAVMPLSTGQLRIDDHEHQALTLRVSTEEVKKALFQMKGLKSPGPDGIAAIFYQRNWDTVFPILLNFVNSALDTAAFTVSLARAHVALIPKEDSPDSIQKFRPISLLNVTYKLLTKVLVNRIRPLLERLVGPHQSSFLPGRSTTDNIILNQEAIHTMRNSKRKK